MTTTFAKSELTPGVPKLVMVEGTPVCVALFEERVYAIADTCTHSDASLSEGELDGPLIECWLHGAQFDIRTGAVATPPATAPATTFHVEVHGDEVTVTKN
jgi:3-phenylpropionate/trans-cinnamate dioxygenase ferredoxin subunit